MSETAHRPVPAEAPSTPPVGADAIKQGLDALRASLPKLQEIDPAAATGLKSFLERASDPVRLNNAEFQHRIAYAVADVQRMIGPFEMLSNEIRQHLTVLSNSSPGLNNLRAENLLSVAKATEDASLRV